MYGKGYYPFTDDCHRIENGTPATNVPVPAGQKRPDPKTATMYSSAWGCKEQFEAGLKGFVIASGTVALWPWTVSAASSLRLVSSTTTGSTGPGRSPNCSGSRKARSVGLKPFFTVPVCDDVWLEHL